MARLTRSKRRRDTRALAKKLGQRAIAAFLLGGGKPSPYPRSERRSADFGLPRNWSRWPSMRVQATTLATSVTKERLARPGSAGRPTFAAEMRYLAHAHGLSPVRHRAAPATQCSARASCNLVSWRPLTTMGCRASNEPIILGCYSSLLLERAAQIEAAFSGGPLAHRSGLLHPPGTHAIFAQ